MLLILTIIVLIFLYICCLSPKKEDYTAPIDNANLSALARDSLQNPKLLDISKIDWSKLTDSQYSDIICQLEGCEERPIIKNLPVFYEVYNRD